ncbi:hypothetical protein ACVIHI_004934 [Bradyrhizobium sp. USDA 4524]|uniref:hypothetical protein n=1 Tax=unclassified Bradyrhizobium TaxID=2631580 RepID=UPI0020A03EB0|nr:MULTISPECIES: hypothetical protein [unclassified Bradyrhizobium]MCP1842147.1 hypothetical protein [Bradyrhizobium sp. USDA 4538]MCP1902711.1 hypothetical protein [Bradyrhizobium sp. USDA 4537]MCP1991632.1 hypothetical protein [Bradyrhizobium sp. USDA 4539]
MLTAEENVELLLRIMEDSLADEIVEEVLSLSQDKLSDAARAHGFKPSSSEPLAVSAGTTSPESAKGADIANNSTPQTRDQLGLASVRTSVEDNLSGNALEKSGAKGAANEVIAATEERLLALLATLEECHAYLQDTSSSDATRLLSLAILEVRMELHRASDTELRALCDAIAFANDAPGEKSEKGPPAKFGVVRKVK